jgi:hypothetical protein
VSQHIDRHLCEDCLEKEYEAYRHARVHEAIKRNEAWMEKYRVGQWPRWDYDFETETLTFSEDGQPRVIADMIVVGSLHGSEWEWAWGNPHMPARSREKMSTVREFGEEKEWSKLTTLFLEGDQYLGWELAAISAHLLGADGAYRCPDSQIPGNFTFVLVFETRYVQ